MRILILEDEPIIAIDLEDLVLQSVDADVVLASTVAEGLSHVDRGIDFAMLDIRLGRRDQTSLPVAARLRDRNIPFCFISSSISQLPSVFRDVPSVGKPFRSEDIEDILPMAA